MKGSEVRAQIPSHKTMLVQLADTPVEKLEELRQYSVDQAKFHQRYSDALARVIKHRKAHQ